MDTKAAFPHFDLKMELSFEKVRVTNHFMKHFEGKVSMIPKASFHHHYYSGILVKYMLLSQCIKHAVLQRVIHTCAHMYYQVDQICLWLVTGVLSSYWMEVLCPPSGFYYICRWQVHHTHTLQRPSERQQDGEWHHFLKCYLIIYRVVGSLHLVREFVTCWLQHKRVCFTNSLFLIGSVMNFIN